MYQTRISLKKRRISSGSGRSVRSGRALRVRRRMRRREVRNSVFAGFSVTAVAGFCMSLVAGLFLLSFLQVVSQDLPTPEKPFGKKATTSEIYDRNGNILYRVFDDEDRDPVRLNEVPPLVKWAFIAAEDATFYEHHGIDPAAMARCALRMLDGDDNICGGSTITQQLIKKTALTDEVNMERKLKEIILALKIEQDRSKDEILEMYLTVVPEGSNIYGITRGSQFYFGKDLDELSLAEISILASIPQNPSRLSPTKSLVPEKAQALLRERQLYVLDQIEKNMDRINSAAYQDTGSDKPLVTAEMIEEARGEKLVFKQPRFEINAPHFVFYAQQLLQERGYNNGKPFDLSEIETEGLRIYTTLDMEHQRVAEDQVRKAVDRYGTRYGADNAAMVSLDPDTGEVLAYVGSYNYFGEAKPAGCRLGQTCTFEPQVSVPGTLQSYGSTLKPIIYYKAFMDGLIEADSVIPDVPIQIGSYKPKITRAGFTDSKAPAGC
ncbi:MAG: Penicillin-binding protein 1F [candidate division WS6 bacterium OLB20]|uniref:peptidoglycan glycosyltransferase n=1 Tax=candidate division WS6 bacterium OLB20 TaxID=1617426 RepID=A0A136LZK8_9BACT|nr:MAG: Penicillin-binding protein 1F [candidate division WS6 bacterium OLB20]